MPAQPDATNSLAYRELRRLLRVTRLSLDALRDQLEEGGFVFSTETIRSWGKAGRSFPADPRLLVQILRTVLRRTHAVDATFTASALRFLVLAGYPPEQLDALIGLFPPTLFHPARQAAVTQAVAVAGAYDHDAALALLNTASADALSTPRPLPYGSLPPPLPPAYHFRGRDQVLTAAFEALRAGRRVALVGIGGSGKTTLASELAHRCGAYFAGGVFWLNAASGEHLPSQIARCGAADALALHPGFAQLGLDAQLRLVRAAWAQPIPRLIILDNVEEHLAIELLGLQAGGSKLLITSRRTDWGHIPAIQVFALSGLPRMESVALLAESLAAAGDAATVEDLDCVAGLVNDLPLGLALAGRYLRQRDLPAHERLGSLITALGSPGVVSDTAIGADLAGLRQLLVTTLAQLDPEDTTDHLAQRLLACAACLAPGEPVDRNLLTTSLAGVDHTFLPERERRRHTRAIERLLDLGLLERATSLKLRVHRLVAAAVGAARQHEVAAVLVREWRQHTAHGRMAWPEPHMSHLRHLTDMLLSAGDDVGGLLGMEFGWYCSQTSRHELAIAYQQRSLELLRALRGWDDESAESLCRLALAYQMSGQMRRAEELWEQLLEIDRRRLPGESLPLAVTLTNVGYIKLNMGKFAQAAALLQAALDLRRKHLPLRHHQIARTLQLLGRLAWYQGRYRAARRLLHLAIRITTSLLGEQEPTLMLAHLHGLLGEVELSRGDYRRALAAFQRAHTIRRHHLQAFQGPDGRILHQSIALDLYAFGRVAAAQGERMAALRYYREALAINEQVLGPDTTETANIAESLGVWYGERGEVAQALGMLHYARDVYVRTIGHHFPDLARIQLSIARVWIGQERWAEAIAALHAAQTTMECCGLPSHPLCGWIAAAKGDVYAQQGEHAQSQQHYQRAIALIKQEAPQHPKLALYQLQL